MALVTCVTAFSQASFRAEVGDVYEDSADIVVKYADKFADPDSLTVGTSESVTVAGVYLTNAVDVTVPAITDPDIASVDVDISTSGGLTFAAAVGDVVVAVPQAAMETACRIQNAYVIAADSIRVVFGSLGGNVTGGTKSFKFFITDLT